MILGAIFSIRFKQSKYMNKITIFFTLVFISVSIFLYKGLHYDPKKIESPLIGKTFPKFKLTDLYTKDTLTNNDFLEKNYRECMGQLVS